jgi:hypothetical protein
VGLRLLRPLILVVTAAIVLVLLASGCGQSDPFVGTWTGPAGASGYWVISKSGDSYGVTGFITSFPHAERQGDKLTFWTEPEEKLGGEPRIKMTVTSTGPDKLMLTDAYGPGLHLPLHKVSDSTRTPSPFYGHQSPAPGP